MKNSNFVFLMIIFLSPVFAFSQYANLGLGYNVGIHASNKGMNYVLDRYNETRSYLAATMGKPSVFRGMTYYMDIYLGKRIFDFDLTYNKSYCFAEGVDNTQSLVHRDIRFKATSCAMGYGKKVISGKRAMGIYIGVDGNIMFLKVATRKYTVGQFKPEYVEVQDDVNLGLTPFVQWVGNRISTKAYLRVLLLNNSYYYLNRTINPGTYVKDNSDDIEGRLVSVGFSARYNLFKNNRKK